MNVVRRRVDAFAKNSPLCVSTSFNSIWFSFDHCGCAFGKLQIIVVFLPGRRAHMVLPWKLWLSRCSPSFSPSQKNKCANPITDTVFCRLFKKPSFAIGLPLSHCFKMSSHCWEPTGMWQPLIYDHTLLTTGLMRILGSQKRLTGLAVSCCSK